MFKKTLGVMILLVSNGSFGEEKDVILTDPTRPAEFVDNGISNKSSQFDDAKLDLEGIVISGDYRAAIINNKILLVGNKIGSYEVMAIQESSVTLQGKNGSSVVLELLADDVKEDVE